MRDGEYLKRFTERKFIVSWDLTHWRILWLVLGGKLYADGSAQCPGHVMDRRHADISANPSYNGDFDQALRSIKALACVMPGSTDLFCTADDNEYEAKLIPHAVFNPIESIWGHFAGRGINQADNKCIDDNLKRLMALKAKG